MPPYSESNPENHATGGKGADIVVVIDPYSTGCLVAQEISKRGFHIMCVWTKSITEEYKTHIPTSCGHLEYYTVLDEKDTFEETLSAITKAAAPFSIVACIPGGESAGVELADALSERLGLRSNGTDIKNRRDKKVQQELIQAAGLRSVRQAGGSKFEQVEQFLKTESYPVVVKPNESAGSDGVKLCHNYEEAKEHFHALMKSQMVTGGACPAVLCQEFLKGKEFVVDHVSMDGVHKTAMVWVYDKRPVNGAAFVYFGCVPVDPESPEAKLLIPYVRRALDAIGFKNGPSHGEVIMTADGPCLVEMNCRSHGGNGNWRSLCRALTGGYSQVEAAADAFVDEAQFMSLPDKPPSPFKASGQEVILVSFSRGTTRSTPGFDVIKQLPSFVYLESHVKKGAEVDFTVDLGTCIGSVILMHKDEKVLKRDMDFIRYMEEINGLFLYETKLENLKRPTVEAVLVPSVRNETGKRDHRRVFSSDGPRLHRHMSIDRPELNRLVKRMTTIDASKEVVVVVDPYSTGCLVVKEILNRTYKVIALWTNGFSEEMKTHVPLSCGNIHYHAEVTEVGSLADTARAVYKAAKQFRIVACIAGGEAGVDMADALSERLGVRTNGTDIPNRRDKKLQQELIKERGLRSVRQAGGADFADVEEFLKTEEYPVVLKPVESAGSDGVKLCHNFDEAKEHFLVLMKSQMVNGGDCPAVLCQEFLKGKEYVVDHVSRDGVHKTVMVWVYDKRPCNGSAFVYFGCVPVDPESPEAKLVIPYVRGVLDSLGFKNGPSHGEVMMTPNGPCLVEMNCRAHGGDGNWRPLCRALTGGYSQVEATVDAFLDKRQFFMLPDKPPSPFKASGQEVILVSFSRGKVVTAPGFEKIKQLQSFVYLETGVRDGSHVDYTIDLFTGIGSVILMHRDKNVLENDVNTVRQMEKDNALFEYESPVGKGIMNSPSIACLVGLNNKAGHHRVISSDRPELYN